MELYEFELMIEADKQQGFEKYFLDRAGRKNFRGISDSVVENCRNCYIECEQNLHMLKTDRLIAYINYLFNNSDLRGQIEKSFECFDKNNLFFELY
ncbi:MAG: hypothetical protein NC489_26260 [Ruminococcus flavefaciens]|nr:hypothetical protein [Ruminococcus flavefaciens]